MLALIVVESMFGNTRAVADAVAQGMRSAVGEVVVVDVTRAPSVVPEGLDLLVVGGPTHAFSMTRRTTREDALHTAGSVDEARAAIGIREWVDGAAPAATVRVVTFDTRVKKAFIPGSAAKSAAKALTQRGFEQVERGETFWVEDSPGPLKAGELDRARAWGVTLAG